MQMYRFVIIAAVIMIAGMVLPEGAQAQAPRSDIMFVDLDSVFTNYYKTRSAEAQLKEQADDVKIERKDMITRLKDLEGEYKALEAQSKSSALNDDVRAKKKSDATEKLIEARNLEGEIEKLERATQKKFEEQSRRARKRLLGEINKVIEEYAEDKQLTAIIDRSGQTLNGVSTIVFYRKELDITEDIVELINAGQ